MGFHVKWDILVLPSTSASRSPAKTALYFCRSSHHNTPTSTTTYHNSFELRTWYSYYLFLKDRPVAAVSISLEVKEQVVHSSVFRALQPHHLANIHPHFPKEKQEQIIMSVVVNEDNDADDSLVISNNSHADDDDDGGLLLRDHHPNNENILISQFLAFTGTSDNEVARQYLEMSDNNALENAVNLFWVATTTNNNVNHEDGHDDEPTMTMEIEEEEEENNNNNNNNNTIVLQEGSDHFSEEPDYDHLLAEEDADDAVKETQADVHRDDDDDDDDDDNTSSSIGLVDSSPDYDYLGLDSVFDEDNVDEENDHPQVATWTRHVHENRVGDTNDLVVSDNPDPNGIYPTKGHNVDIHDDDDDDDEEEDIGEEEYILGTMMVRVLQARHVKVCVFILG